MKMPSIFLLTFNFLLTDYLYDVSSSVVRTVKTPAIAIPQGTWALAVLAP
jgi:hypothetical protein